MMMYEGRAEKNSVDLEAGSRDQAAVVAWPAACLPALGPPLDGPVAARLRPHVVRQLTNASCSVAVVTALINAARAAHRQAPLGQREVVGLDDSGAWAAQTAHDLGCGVSLGGLAERLRQVAAAVLLPDLRAWTLPFAADTACLRRRARALFLAQRRAPGRIFIAANFLQSHFVAGGGPIGHHALCADLAADGRHVGVFDVDPEVFGEYRVAWENFFAGLLPQPSSPTVRGLTAVALDAAGAALVEGALAAQINPRKKSPQRGCG